MGQLTWATYGRAGFSPLFTNTVSPFFSVVLPMLVIPSLLFFLVFSPLGFRSCSIKRNDLPREKVPSLVGGRE